MAPLPLTLAQLHHHRLVVHLRHRRGLCRVCGNVIEQVFGRWYHVDHHLRVSAYDHEAQP